MLGRPGGNPVFDGDTLHPELKVGPASDELLVLVVVSGDCEAVKNSLEMRSSPIHLQPQTAKHEKMAGASQRVKHALVSLWLWK